MSLILPLLLFFFFIIIFIIIIIISIIIIIIIIILLLLLFFLFYFFFNHYYYSLDITQTPIESDKMKLDLGFPEHEDENANDGFDDECDDGF